jgi:hypothetical protein
MLFVFALEPEIGLLTATRTGFWSLLTVAAYELALRRELTVLQKYGPRTAFIIDIRSTGAQPKEVADALRAMVGRLGPLDAKRTAVVTASGIAKLQARRVADPNSKVFTSLVLARDWALGRCRADPSESVVYDEASDAEAEGRSVHVHGPSDLEINLTPRAALETAKRIGDAAIEALLERAPVIAKTAAIPV